MNEALYFRCGLAYTRTVTVGQELVNCKLLAIETTPAGCLVKAHTVGQSFSSRAVNYSAFVSLFTTTVKIVENWCIRTRLVENKILARRV